MAFIEGPNHPDVVAMYDNIAICIAITWIPENGKFKGYGFCPTYVPPFHISNWDWASKLPSADQGQTQCPSLSMHWPNVRIDFWVEVKRSVSCLDFWRMDSHHVIHFENQSGYHDDEHNCLGILQWNSEREGSEDGLVGIQRLWCCNVPWINMTSLCETIDFQRLECPYLVKVLEPFFGAVTTDWSSMFHKEPT